MFVCAFNRFLCFRVKSFFYDVKYRRFFGFLILGEDLDDLGGFLKSAFILSLFLLLGGGDDCCCCSFTMMMMRMAAVLVRWWQ